MGSFMRANSFAPSKRVIALAIGIVALIAAVIVARQPNTSQQVGIVFSNNPRTSFDEIDTDGDGLKDWEEELWGLDPNNPDTHGTGEGDAVYVTRERARVAAVPESILNIYEATPDQQPSSIALAGQILLSQLFASKEAGLPIPQKSVELAGEIALQDIDTTRTYTTYTQANIALTNDSSDAALRAYGNRIGQALGSANGEAVHELFVILSYVQTNDAEKFKQQMSTVIENYNRVINRLLAVPTPTTTAQLHVALINALVRVKTDLIDIRDIEASPIKATIALAAYEKNSTSVAQLFEQMRTVLRLRNISYAEAEAGYALMQTNN